MTRRGTIVAALLTLALLFVFQGSAAAAGPRRVGSSSPGNVRTLPTGVNPKFVPSTAPSTQGKPSAQPNLPPEPKVLIGAKHPPSAGRPPTSGAGDLGLVPSGIGLPIAGTGLVVPPLGDKPEFRPAIGGPQTPQVREAVIDQHRQFIHDRQLLVHDIQQDRLSGHWVPGDPFCDCSHDPGVKREWQPGGRSRSSGTVLPALVALPVLDSGSALLVDRNVAAVASPPPIRREKAFVDRLDVIPPDPTPIDRGPIALIVLQTVKSIGTVPNVVPVLKTQTSLAGRDRPESALLLADAGAPPSASVDDDAAGSSVAQLMQSVIAGLDVWSAVDRVSLKIPSSLTGAIPTPPG